ncbi:MAG: AAA family ATPase [Bdellovibrionales bacterium]|nr:AAA family ATPase [Bdellovibrionales bacterium]
MSNINNKDQGLNNNSQQRTNEKEDLRRKAYEIQKHETETRHAEIERGKKELIRLDSVSVSPMDDKQLVEMKAANIEYFNSAKTAPKFLLPELSHGVSLTRKSLTMIGAPSGEGKSNVSANATYSMALQGKRVLVISNEELASDIYNRVTCLMKGWTYNDHGKFTEEQIKIFNDYYEILRTKITVIDHTMAPTTTIEGIDKIFEDLKSDSTKYDLIIIDYYQNVDSSSLNKKVDIYEAQTRFANALDKFKNIYPAPILLLAQVAKETKKDQRSFKERIEGRKIIYNKATVAIELVTDHAECRTEWIFHKSRFGRSGVRVSTGWDRGLYVSYTEEFKTEIAKKNLDEALLKMQVKND